MALPDKVMSWVEKDVLYVCLCSSALIWFAWPAGEVKSFLFYTVIILLFMVLEMGFIYLNHRLLGWLRLQGIIQAGWKEEEERDKRKV